MTTAQVLLLQWYWDPLGLALCAAVIVGFAWRAFHTRGPRNPTVEPGRKPKAGYFWFGFAILVLALLSPLTTLARSYLFSAHMLQHLLLLMVVPPLLLLGTVDYRSSNSRVGVSKGSSAAAQPGRKSEIRSSKSETNPNAWEYLKEQIRRSRLSWPTANNLEDYSAGAAPRFARATWFLPLCWLAGVGSMWFWHIPSLCNAASSSPAVYHVQVVTLLGLGTLFWWPIVGRGALARLSPLAGIAYLVTACFGCTLLGMYVTFAPVSVCPVYEHPADPLGIVPLIQTGWHLSPETDQQVGGLLMWVPACLIYLSGVLGLLARWYAEGESTLPTSPPLPEPQKP